MEFHATGEEFVNDQKIYGWSEEFQCKTIDGYLAPTPISYIPLPTDEKEHKPRKKRATRGNENLFFRLYKFSEGVEYLLEMYEEGSGRVDRTHLVPEENEGKWKLGVFDLEPGTYVVFPVLQDPFLLNSPPKMILSLQDRLRGWTIEKRKCCNEKEVKFYYHGGKQYRSFVEVTTFIFFATKSKEDLKGTMNIPTNQNETKLH